MLMSEKVQVNMSISPPLVYFDTCAYDLFFRLGYQEERKVFVQIMDKKRATLMVSWANIVELGGRLCDDEIERICSFLDEVVTRPIEVEPRKVIKTEQTIIRERKTFLSRYLPIVCEEIMEWFADTSNWERRQGIDCYPRITEFLRKYHYAVKKKQKLEKHFDSLCKRIEDIQINKIRKANLKLVIQKHIKAKIKLKEKNEFPIFTDEIFSLAVQFILKSDCKNFSTSTDWFDVLHAVVPIAYCDIIVLDRRWQHFSMHFLKNNGLVHCNKS